MRPSTLLFGCRTPEESTRKASFEVYGWSLCPVFWLGKKHIFKAELTCAWVEYRLCLAFIVCIQAAFKLQIKGLLTWVRKDKQICIHACIHTHTHTFHKTISGNQVRAHSQPGRAPGLKVRMALEKVAYWRWWQLCLQYYATRDVIIWIMYCKSSLYQTCDQMLREQNGRSL